MNSRGEHVVGALAHIAIVVRVDAGKMCEHLVYVHIRLRSASRLIDDQRERICVIGAEHLIACVAYSFAFIFAKFTRLKIRLCCAPFYGNDCPYHIVGHLFAYDEILKASLSLRSPKFIRFDFDFAEAVLFNPILHNF